MKDWLDLLARVFISFLFFTQAGLKIYRFENAVTYLEKNGWEWQANLIVLAAIGLLLLGSSLVLLGYRMSFGAALLLIYLVPSTVFIYDFWNDPLAEKQERLDMFMRNLAIAGGLIYVMLNSNSGRFSMRRLFASTRV